MHFSEFEQQIEKNNPLDFGDILSKSIELFKKVWLQGFVQYLLSGLLILPVILGVYFIVLMIAVPAGLYFEEGGSVEFSEGFNVLLGVCMFLLMILMVILSVVVQIALRAAFFRICKNKDMLENKVSDDYFYFLKKRYLKKIFLLAVISVTALCVGLLLFVIPGIFLIIPFSLLPVVFAFNFELSVKEILKLSLDLGKKKWGIAFGLMIVSWLLAVLVGTIACGVGVYFTQSFILLPFYYIYKDTIGFGNGQTEIDEIGSEYSN